MSAEEIYRDIAEQLKRRGNEHLTDYGPVNVLKKRLAEDPDIPRAKRRSDHDDP